MLRRNYETTESRKRGTLIRGRLYGALTKSLFLKLFSSCGLCDYNSAISFYKILSGDSKHIFSRHYY